MQGSHLCSRWQILLPHGYVIRRLGRRSSSVCRICCTAAMAFMGRASAEPAPAVPVWRLCMQMPLSKSLPRQVASEVLCAEVAEGVCRCHIVFASACILVFPGQAAVPLLAQVMQAYAKQFPDLAEAAQVIVSSSSDGARLLPLQ